MIVLKKDIFLFVSLFSFYNKKLNLKSEKKGEKKKIDLINKKSMKKYNNYFLSLN